MPRIQFLSAFVIALLLCGPAAAQEWLKLEPTGTLPPGRIATSAVYDPGGNRMTIFGGGLPGLFNDVWVLSNANGADATAPSWTQLSPDGTLPPVRYAHTAVYDVANNRMIIFGGSNGIGSCSGTKNDVWVLKDANGVGSPEWIQLYPTLFPPGHCRDRPDRRRSWRT